MNWHFHKWAKWVDLPPKYISYPWTEPGAYSYIQREQQRTYTVCNKRQVREVK